MATGGGAGSVLLTGSDEITVKLLSHVSLHVKPETCKQFATGPLGLKESRYDLIAADNRYQAEVNIEVGK